VSDAFTAEERRAIGAGIEQGGDLRCPACGAALAATAVEPPAEVAYVRRRVLVVCAGCRRSASVDVRR
jgi:hypothetical protein